MLKRGFAPGRAMQRAFPVLVLCLGATGALGADGSAGSPANHLFQWRPFLAPFHAVVLHFPIGFITMAFVLELYQLRRPGEEVRRITRLTIWLSLITGIISATLGLLRAAGGGYEPQLVQVHRAAGLAVPFFTIATLFAQKFSLTSSRFPVRQTYRGLLAATLGLLVLAGHYGGNLTHGSKYLVENAPQFVRELLDDDDPPSPNGAQTAAAGPEAGDEKHRHFVEKVRPVFQAKCVRCHGAEKQKGGYRLDRPEVALKGGESKKVAILPGHPVSSHLVELILQKPGSEDIMPPDGKEPLTRDEIMSIIEWIRDGAVFTTGVGENTAEGG